MARQRRWQPDEAWRKLPIEVGKTYRIKLAGYLEEALVQRVYGRGSHRAVMVSGVSHTNRIGIIRFRQAILRAQEDELLAKDGGVAS
jgi:hypothetical protein